MEKSPEGKEDGKACCWKERCCGKVLAALALLLVGGAGGFFAGRHCNKICPTGAPSAASAPTK